jgi:AbrB family looped-hinge helix DNA binding protein
MPTTTSTTIDAAGRIVIPKQLREAAGLRPGTRLHVALRDGVLEVSPAPVDIRVVGHGPLRVAEADLPPLTVDDVRAAQERIRDGRA